MIWALVSVTITLRLDAAEHSIPMITGLSCMRVPLILALAILFDVRDQGSDDPALRTVPMVFGTRGAKALALFLLLCSAAFEVVFLRSLGFITASWTILAGYAFGVWLTVKAKPVRDPFYYGILVDGVMIVVPLCAWAGTLF
jgi:hypothetical protein